MTEEAAGDALKLRTTGDGYEYVSDRDPHSGGERPVYVHRLCAVAWGDYETTGEACSDVARKDVHHSTPREWLSEEEQLLAERSIPWLNVEEALHPEDRTEHRRMALAYAAQTDGGRNR